MCLVQIFVLIHTKFSLSAHPHVVHTVDIHAVVPNFYICRPLMLGLLGGQVESCRIRFLIFVGDPFLLGTFAGDPSIEHSEILSRDLPN